MVMVGVSPYPADNPATIAWTRGYWAELHPYAGGGAYINMMMDAVDEGQDWARLLRRAQRPSGRDQGEVRPE
jgi:hypothetical protein